jgi:2-iminobutanoate/2-iminopropanoate deaminase
LTDSINRYLIYASLFKEEEMKKLRVVILLLITVLFFSISFGQSYDSGQAPVKKEIIKMPGVTGLPFSPAVKFGSLVFLSGVVGTDPKTGELVSSDVGGQTKQCLEILGAILRQAKMDYSNVVSCTVYLTDLKDFVEMNKAYSVYFPEDPPSRACVQVAGLVRGAKVEISLIAAK